MKAIHSIWLLSVLIFPFAFSFPTDDTNQTQTINSRRSMIGRQPFIERGVRSDLQTLRFDPWDLVLQVEWSPDGQLLAISSGNHIIVFNVLSGEIKYDFKVGSFSPDLEFNSNGDLLVSGSRDGVIRIWQISSTMSSEPEIKFLREFDAHPKGVNSIAFDVNGDNLASGGNDAVGRYWKIDTGELLTEVIGGSFSIPAVDMTVAGSDTSGSENSVLAVVNGGVVRLRDALSGRYTGTFRTEQPLFRLAFSPDGRLMATGDIGNGVQIWDVSQASRSGNDQDPQPITQFQHRGICEPHSTGRSTGLVWAVAFDKSGDFLASAGGDGCVYLWKLDDGTLAKSFSGHQAAVTSLAFSPDGDWLASGSLDATVRFWKVK